MVLEKVMAQLIHSQLPEPGGSERCAGVAFATLWLLADALAPILHAENPRFERTAFFRACGLEQTTEGVAA